eukprot:7711923-Pyramimonas_sp.AAC.1
MVGWNPPEGRWILSGGQLARGRLPGGAFEQQQRTLRTAGELPPHHRRARNNVALSRPRLVRHALHVRRACAPQSHTAYG